MKNNIPARLSWLCHSDVIIHVEASLSYFLTGLRGRALSYVILYEQSRPGVCVFIGPPPTHTHKHKYSSHSLFHTPFDNCKHFISPPPHLYWLPKIENSTTHTKDIYLHIQILTPTDIKEHLTNFPHSLFAICVSAYQ